MLRTAILLLCLTFAPFAAAQEAKPFTLPTPPGWKTETIALPPGFAKDMEWKGTEDIRFAPGMFDDKADSFFSYVILFWLPDQQDVSDKTLQREFLRYYRGLATAVGKGKNLAIKAEDFTATFEIVKGKKTERDGQPVTEFTGKMKWVEPFATGKEQTLLLDVQSWYCAKAKHQVVLICVSPRGRDADIWAKMLEIRDGFRCAGEK